MNGFFVMVVHTILPLTVNACLPLAFFVVSVEFFCAIQVIPIAWVSGSLGDLNDPFNFSCASSNIQRVDGAGIHYLSLK